MKTDYFLLELFEIGKLRHVFKKFGNFKKLIEIYKWKFKRESKSKVSAAFRRNMKKILGTDEVSP